MTAAGFHGYVSTLANGMPLVDARYKVFLERFLSSLRIKLLWSHLGVRNRILAGRARKYYRSIVAMIRGAIRSPIYGISSTA